MLSISTVFRSSFYGIPLFSQTVYLICFNSNDRLHYLLLPLALLSLNEHNIAIRTIIPRPADPQQNVSAFPAFFIML